MVAYLLPGDALTTLDSIENAVVDCCITSPPYFGLRDYGHVGQIGNEETPEDYVRALVSVFREVRRVLKPEGTLWLNLGDSFNAAGRVGHGTRVGCKQGTNRASANGSDHTRASDPTLKPKDLIGIPWRVAFALQADGWYLRQGIIWHKLNPMPESVKDRFTKSHEYVFLLSKSERYFFDHEAVKEPAVCARTRGPALHRDLVSTNGNAGLSRRSPTGMRSRRDGPYIPTKGFPGAHFAVMPEALVEPCVLAGCPLGGVILDPFMGSGTVAVVAHRLHRQSIGCELNQDYVKVAMERMRAAGATVEFPAGEGAA